MDLGLRGKRALITGGSKGIGLAIARVLAAEGASVGLVARDAATELAPLGIRVNAVSPGSIMFPGGGWEWFSQHDPDLFADWLARDFPHGRLGHPEEVADVVAFLLSQRASWITGANIAVDGAQIYPSTRRFGSA